MSSAKTYFHTFDAMRFFSFLLVFVHHWPLEKPVFVNFFTKSGGIGVLFFFVLSGFLISYLLLIEKKDNGKILLKNFFLRRILRIWPLFYAMILFAFLTPLLLKLLNLSFSGSGYSPDWLMSCLFLENYKIMIEGVFPNVSPLPVMWSLCIEEHFYILWGLCFFFIPVRKIPLFAAISIVLANVVRVFYFFLGINAIDLFANIDFFAFGALIAYTLLFKDKLLKFVEQISLRWKYLFAIFTICLVFVSPNIHSVYTNLISLPVFAICFSILILFTLTKKNRIFISDKSLSSKFGIYTYGLYLYHTIVINSLLRFIEFFSISVNWLIFGVASLILTIIISYLSYLLFEKQFLKLKKYFY